MNHVLNELLQAQIQQFFGETHPSDERLHGFLIAVRQACQAECEKHAQTLLDLRRSEESYRTLFEAAFEGIVIHDNGTVLEANQAALSILQLRPQETIGRHVLDFVAPECRETALRQLRERAELPYELTLSRKDGQPVFVEIISRNHWHQGREVRVVAFRNITTRKKAEAEMQQARQLAEQSVRAKEQFLSVMSHEIRTPLNAVIGMTHLLLEENPLPAQVEQLGAIKFSADNLMIIINDILDFSKIESGMIAFERTSFESAAIFRGIRQSFGYKAAEKGLHLRFSGEETLPRWLIGDPVRLNQILLNLVGNAIKFTETGYVEVIAKVLTQTQETAQIEFRVKDTGIGIPAEKLDAVFESFTQASSETTRKYGGTGLGLTITKRLVELQGGQIHVNSVIGTGSEFVCVLTFGLPAVKPAVIEPDLPEHSEELSGMRILLVEDNRMNQLVVSKFLQKWGVTIDIVADGLEAIEQLKTHTYHLILMDLQMPQMDGYATTRFIREHARDEVKNIPILALTASALLDVRQSVLEAGMNDFITKPFNPKELWHKILLHTRQQPNVVIPSTTSTVNLPKRHVNLQYLEEVSGGDQHFVQSMVQLFLKQTPGFLRTLRQACQTADWNSLRATHKMKATVAMVGITELQPDFAALEKLAVQETQLEEITRLVTHISQVCQEAFSELNEQLVN